VTSPYLQRGREQAVAWRPFSDEPLAAGPVLLVIGESGAHASRVLDQEVFDEPPRALERFVCVRVDAYDRPDLAVRFGGPFPLVALLGPEGAAIERRPTVATVERLLAGAAPTGAERPRDEASGDWEAEALAVFDRHDAGFGGLPKAPRAPLLDLLLDDERHAELALRTLDAMAAGGIHDQLAGGFHRDSTDAKWLVPHFEKRLGDQAALLSTCARAFRLTGDRRWAETARGIAGYVERLARDGAFAAGEDADIGPYDDASHWTWTLEEARAVLSPEEFAVAQPCFDLFGRGELHSDPTRNVLFRAVSVEQAARSLGIATDEAGRRLERARVALLAARDARPRPPVDETVYTAANAHLARALLEAAGALDDDRLRAHGLATLDRLYAGALLDDGRVRHRLGDGGPPDWLPAHAQLALAARLAFQVTGDGRHRAADERIVARVRRVGFVEQRALAIDDEQASPAAQWAELTGDEPPAQPRGIASAALIRIARIRARK
jgi:uncharacterized protein YyaL (SSP411 family)